MNRIVSTVLVLLVTLPCISCIGGARGSVPVDAILPTYEALAPYTRAGIWDDPDLTQEQRENLERELKVSLQLLRGTPN